MPTAAAMAMKAVATRLLARHGYRNVLAVNTIMMKARAETWCVAPERSARAARDSGRASG